MKTKKLSQRRCIDIYKEDMKFSIAHFTIFSETERENIHGHNFEVTMTIEFKSMTNGMFKNYRNIKSHMRKICSSLDEFLILPGLNKFIKIRETSSGYSIKFAKEKLLFLKRDVKILPIENTTVEEFSYWFLMQMIKDKDLIDSGKVSMLKIEVSSFRGQSASAVLEL